MNGFLIFVDVDLLLGCEGGDSDRRASSDQMRPEVLLFKLSLNIFIFNVMVLHHVTFLIVQADVGWMQTLRHLYGLTLALTKASAIVLDDEEGRSSLSARC